MQKSTRTIKVSLETLEKLKPFGSFQESWDDCIKKVLRKLDEKKIS